MEQQISCKLEAICSVAGSSELRLGSSELQARSSELRSESSELMNGSSELRVDSSELHVWPVEADFGKMASLEGSLKTEGFSTQIGEFLT